MLCFITQVLISNWALTTSIPSGTKKQGLFFRFIAYSKSKRAKKKNLIVWQMNAVLCKVTLSSPLKTSHRAH
jgi:hypothetical protein